MKKTKKIKNKNIILNKVIFAIAGLIFIWYNSFLLALLILGMFPTFVTYLTNRKRLDKDKLATIGFFNLSGVLPYLFEIFSSQSAYNSFINITTSSFSWIIIYGSVVIGLGAYYNIPKVIYFIINSWQSARLKKIEKELARIKEQWGIS